MSGASVERSGRARWWGMALSLLLCAVARVGHGQVERRPAALLAEAERVMTLDRPRFLRLLEELHQAQMQLTPAEQRHLQFLDAWSVAFGGNYARADELLRSLIAQPDDLSLSARALALRVHIDFVLRRYEDAYASAYRLMAELPQVSDPTARRDALGEVIQMLERQDQYDLALQYARQMKGEFRSGKARCQAELYETQGLLYSGKLTADSPLFGRSVKTCLTLGERVYANALRLDRASLIVDEGHPDQAIALLHRIAPDIRAAGYHLHLASLDVSFGQAYLAKGDLARARQSALATLARGKPETLGWTAGAAYQVLYQVEKRAGRADLALRYYEKYVAQEEAATSDAKARALAYQMVKQEVLAKKTRVDALSKRNKILQLRQQLDHKAAETARLYAAFLLAAVGLIGLWLYRLKHSQMHFRRMARHDGLTAALNRRYFLDDAAPVLVRLQKAGSPACLVLLDLDHFKRVNDSYGHVAGDDVLKLAAQVMRRELRASDVFGRLGGEEFGILIPSCASVRGMVVAERIRIALATQSIVLDDQSAITVTASLGLACTDTSGYVLRQLLSKADAALYRAKRGGRNRVEAATVDEAERGRG